MASLGHHETGLILQLVLWVLGKLLLLLVLHGLLLHKRRQHRLLLHLLLMGLMLIHAASFLLDLARVELIFE